MELNNKNYVLAQVMPKPNVTKFIAIMKRKYENDINLCEIIPIVIVNISTTRTKCDQELAQCCIKILYIKALIL